MSAFGSLLGAIGGPTTAAALVAGGLVVGVVGGGLVGNAATGGQSGAAPGAGTLLVYPCPDAGPALASVQGGQRLLVTGRTEDGTWLRIHLPAPGRTEGWVQATPLTVKGDVTSLPVVECQAELAIASPSVEPEPSLTAIVNATPPPTASPSPNASPTPTPTPVPSVTPSPTPVNKAPAIAWLRVSTGKISYDTGEYCPKAGTSVTFRVRASDDAGVETVTLFWRKPGASGFSGARMTRVDGSDRRGTWQVTLDTRTNNITKAGKLAFYAVATDAAGKEHREPRRGSNTITVNVCENTGPSITSVSSSAGRTLYSNPAGAAGCDPSSTNITAVVKDVDGVASVTLYYKRPGDSTWSSKPMDNTTISGKWYANLDTLRDKLSPGSMDWQIRAKDTKEKGSRTDTRTITVLLCDKTPPSIGGWTLSSKSIYSGGPCSPTTMTAWVAVTDSGSGVSSVSVRLRNAQTGGVTGAQSAANTRSGWQTTWNGADLGGSTRWTFQVLATDKAGNSTGWVTSGTTISVLLCQ